MALALQDAHGLPVDEDLGTVADLLDLQERGTLQRQLRLVQDEAEVLLHLLHGEGPTRVDGRSERVGARQQPGAPGQGHGSRGEFGAG